MSSKIRPNQNAPAATLPVDTEIDAVITTPYLFNSTTGEWEAEGTQFSGTWKYYSGVSGVVNVLTGEKILGIAGHATVAGSMVIGTGSSIPIPATSAVEFRPQRILVGPVSITFTGTDSYVIEVVS